MGWDYFLHLPIDLDQDAPHPTFDILSKKIVAYLEEPEPEVAAEPENDGGWGRHRDSVLTKFYAKEDKLRWLAVLSWSFGASTEGSRRSRGADGTSVSDLSIMVSGDEMMPIYQAILLSGEKFPVVVMNGVNKKDDKVELIENIFTNVRLTSFQLSASSEIPTCSISIIFDTIETSYYAIDIVTGDITTRTTSKYDIKTQKGCRSLIGGKVPQPKSLFAQAKEAVKLNIKELTAQDLNSLEQLKIFTPDELPTTTDTFPLTGIKLNIKINGKENAYKEAKLKKPTRQALLELIAERTKEKIEDIIDVYRTSQGIDIEIETDEHVKELTEEERVRYDTKASKEEREKKAAAAEKEEKKV